MEEINDRESVITIDNSISVFAELVNADLPGSEIVYELIMHHLNTCKPREVPQHAERTFICINASNAARYKEILEHRLKDLSDSQKKRVQKLINKINRLEFAT